MHQVARRAAPARRRHTGGLTAALLVGASAGLAVTVQPPVRALPTGCPRIVPVSEVSRGMHVTGLTTGSGTTPERFRGEVLGTLADGIAPGVPMILVRTRSRTIDRVGGIWAGMSGSPVYTGDGRLIGAVAYGLSVGPSKIAGLTPAEHMMELLAQGVPAPPPGRSPAGLAASVSPSRVTLAWGTRGNLGVPPAPPRRAGGGLRQLPMPLGLSGFSAARFEQVGRAVARSTRLNALAYQAGAVPASAAGAPAGVIRAGGNFAAALSYGDVTAAGIGTTTVACDGFALAFGHPFLFAGPTSMTAHGASAITIQDDPAGGPFKVANPGGVAGIITADRLAGVRAQLGAAPRPIAVTSTVTDRAPGRSRTGQTLVNVGEFVPTMAASHLLANIDRVFDRIGPGRSTVTWTATGTFAGGRPWRLTRGNRFSSHTDLGFDSVAELLDFLTVLRDNEYQAVTFDSVAIVAEVAAPPRELRVGELRWKDATGKLVRLGPASTVRVRPGGVLTLQARLDGVRGGGPARFVELRVKVPAGAAGKQGTVSVAGGLAPEASTDECLFDPTLCASVVEGRSADEVLRVLAAEPRNDDVVATLSFDLAEADAGPAVPAAPVGGDPLLVRATARAGDVVKGESPPVTVVVAGQPSANRRVRASAGRLLAPPRRPTSARAV